MHPIPYVILALVALHLPLGSNPEPAGPTLFSDTAIAGPHPCPREHPRSAARVRIFLTNPLLPELRSRFDLGAARAEDVRLLGEADDRETCAALWNALEETADALAPGDQVTFYRSGDRFLVPITRYRPAQPGVVRLDGPSALHVYDAEFRLIGRFAT